jgi:hypothetical protein
VVLSKREKYIGIGAVGAVVILALNSFVYGPYEDRMAELKDEVTKAHQQRDANDHILKEQKDLQAEWSAMLANGLESDDSTAASRTQQAIQNWASSANISLESTNPDHQQAQKGAFQTVIYSLDFNVAGNDSMRNVSRFLWAVETAKIPLRLNNLRVQAAREGSNEMNVKMVVSALYMPPTGQQGNGPGGLEDFYDMEGNQ